jgi:hypothetical protein
MVIIVAAHSGVATATVVVKRCNPSGEMDAPDVVLKGQVIG